MPRVVRCTAGMAVKLTNIGLAIAFAKDMDH